MKLFRKDFKKWLESKSPRSIVGFPRLAGMCPIAKYVESTGKKEPFIGVEEYGYNLNRRWNKTPLWAAEFIRNVDRKRTPITAAAALKVLNAKKEKNEERKKNASINGN